MYRFRTLLVVPPKSRFEYPYANPFSLTVWLVGFSTGNTIQCYSKNRVVSLPPVNPSDTSDIDKNPNEWKRAVNTTRRRRHRQSSR